MQYGFSVTAFLFAVLLVGPGIYWANLPEYPGFRKGSAGAFLALERIGLTLALTVALIDRRCDFRPGGFGWILFLLAWSFLCLFELHWLWCIHRHCRPRTLGRLPLTVLPALALLLLGLYSGSFWLSLAAVLYGIGHVGGRRPGTEWCCCCQDTGCRLPASYLQKSPGGSRRAAREAGPKEKKERNSAEETVPLRGR